MAETTQPRRRAPRLTETDRFPPFAEHAGARLAEEPHLLASTLVEEMIALGYVGGDRTAGEEAQSD